MGDVGALALGTRAGPARIRMHQHATPAVVHLWDQRRRSRLGRTADDAYRHRVAAAGCSGCLRPSTTLTFELVGWPETTVIVRFSFPVPASPSEWRSSSPTTPIRPRRPDAALVPGVHRAHPADASAALWSASCLPSRCSGSTGHDSTRVIFGAAALGGMSQDRADATLALVHEWGINHIDTPSGVTACPRIVWRPRLAEHRRDVFLATKTGERNGTDARAELERSLERMQVEHVDLIQLHNLVEPDEFDTVFVPEVPSRRWPRPETKASFATSGSPATACAQPREVRLRVGSR